MAKLMEGDAGRRPPADGVARGRAVRADGALGGGAVAVASDAVELLARACTDEAQALTRSPQTSRGRTEMLGVCPTASGRPRPGPRASPGIRQVRPGSLTGHAWLTVCIREGGDCAFFLPKSQDGLSPQ